jgi:putative copper resistance protein D
LSDAAIWNVVQFLRALSEADAASALTTQVERLRPLVAPDFTFEIGAGAQESLQQQRGHPTLLVLYALPGSLPRVRMLAAEESRFSAAGVRVIAVQVGDATGAFAAESGVLAGSIFALAGADVGVAYAMFACPTGAECARPVHSEFLIDRAGYLRARWTGDAGAGDAWTNAILREVAVLEREPPHPPAPEEHMH